MRLSIFIFISFISIILLTITPYHFTVNGFKGVDYGGSLPDFFNFTLICAAALIASFALYTFIFGKKLQGQCLLTRKNKNLDDEYNKLAFWAAIIIACQFLPYDYFYFFNGTVLYHFTILFAILLFQLFTRWYTRKYTPVVFAIGNGFILSGSVFGIRRRNIQNIKAVSYNARRNYITLQFKEGLDNIKLYIKDYESGPVQKFLAAIESIKEGGLHFDENFPAGFQAVNS